MPHEYAPRSRAVLAYANLMVDLLTDRGAWAPDAGAATPVTSHWRAEGAVL
jgi:hypothetical protein